VIGGEDLYRTFWHRANRLYLTHVHAEVKGDTRIPDVDPQEWRKVAYECFPAGDGNEFAFSCVDYTRVNEGV
jgi:dihydrofolate reductase